MTAPCDPSPKQHRGTAACSASKAGVSSLISSTWPPDIAPTRHAGIMSLRPSTRQPTSMPGPDCVNAAGGAPQLAQAVEGLVEGLARDDAQAGGVEPRLAPVPRAQRAQAQQRHRAVAVRRAHACALSALRDPARRPLILRLTTARRWCAQVLQRQRPVCAMTDPGQTGRTCLARRTQHHCSSSQLYVLGSEGRRQVFEF